MTTYRQRTKNPFSREELVLLQKLESELTQMEGDRLKSMCDEMILYPFTIYYYFPKKVARDYYQKEYERTYKEDT